MTSKVLDTQLANRDWFVAAIQTDGSVMNCLAAVLTELEYRARFTKALQLAIGERAPGGIDTVSDVGQRIKILENTLRFRLSILNPERKGAWFRVGSPMGGPFSGTLLNEAVFSAYDEGQHGRMRKGISNCWQKRSLIDYPFRATDPSLWKVLLSLNFELEALDRFSLEFPRLSELPDQLPSLLESRSLRAFLLNVRAEIVSHRVRLTQCYNQLFEASERFWQHHATAASRKSEGADRDDPIHHFRSSFKQRRTPTTPRPSFKTSSDLEALKFMGFADYPSTDDLKQRYHSLALEMHPDRPSGNEQRFKLLNRSYKHLAKICG